MVWCDIVWYCMIWYDIASCCIVSYGIVWYRTVWYRIVSCGIVSSWFSVQGGLRRDATHENVNIRLVSIQSREQKHHMSEHQFFHKKRLRHAPHFTPRAQQRRPLVRSRGASKVRDVHQTPHREVGLNSKLVGSGSKLGTNSTFERLSGDFMGHPTVPMSGTRYI